MPELSEPMPAVPASTTASRVRVATVMLLLLLPLAALGSRFGWWPFTTGFLLSAISVLGCVLILLICAVWLWRTSNAATRSILTGSCLLALPPILVVAVLLSNSNGRVSIHNISTDTTNPPVFVAAVKQRGAHSNPLAYSKEVATIQRQHYPDITTIQTSLLPPQTFNRALAVAGELGWDIYAQVPQEGRIEAVDTTLWYGFKDDIVIRITTADTGGSLVDLRSVSRVGKSDIGANAKRIRTFRERFNAE